MAIWETTDYACWFISVGLGALDVAASQGSGSEGIHQWWFQFATGITISATNKQTNHASNMAAVRAGFHCVPLINDQDCQQPLYIYIYIYMYVQERERESEK